MKGGPTLKNTLLRPTAHSSRAGGIVRREAAMGNSMSELGVRLCGVETSLIGSGGDFSFRGSKRRRVGFGDLR